MFVGARPARDGWEFASLDRTHGVLLPVWDAAHHGLRRTAGAAEAHQFVTQ